MAVSLFREMGFQGGGRLGLYLRPTAAAGSRLLRRPPGHGAMSAGFGEPNFHPGIFQSIGTALQRRCFRHRGVLKLLCGDCRYVVKRWHVPILAVDCNANPRHKQALTNPPPRSRPIPDYLLPWLEGKQYPRHPRWRMDALFTAYHKKHSRKRNI